MDSKITILAISGSLRKISSNTTILQSIGKLLPQHVSYQLYEKLEDIPAFNPEKDIEPGIASVIDFRQQVKQADGVIICTPEYAFGVPGALKNALDWTVSSAEFNEKPVIAISASPLPTGGDKALTSLLLTLKALGTKMDEHSSLSIPVISHKIKNGELMDEATVHALKRLMEHVLELIINNE